MSRTTTDHYAQAFTNIKANLVPDNDDDYYTTRKSTDPYDDYYDDPGEELGLLPGVKRIECKGRHKLR